MKPSLFYRAPVPSNSRRGKGSVDQRQQNDSFRNAKSAKERSSGHYTNQDETENLSNNDNEAYNYMSASHYSTGGYQKVSSPTKSSKQVLKRVFDEDFAIHSSNKKKRPEEGVSTLLANSIASRIANSNFSVDPENQMATIANNLANLRIDDGLLEDGYSNQQQIKEEQGTGQQSRQRPLNQEQSRSEANLKIREKGDERNYSYDRENVKVNYSVREEGILNPVDMDYLDSCYKTFISSVANDQIFSQVESDMKIRILVENLSHPHQEIALGALIFLFEIIYGYRDSLSEDSIEIILTEIYFYIPLFYEKRNYYLILAGLEVLGLIGPHNISYSNIKLLISILLDENIPTLQEEAFFVLTTLDYPGLYALVDVANRDFNDIALFILNKLVEVPEIQTLIIIPSLLNDLQTAQDSKKRLQALAALNRMYSLNVRAGSLPVLVGALTEGNMDRQTLASTIRGTGEIGEQALLRIIAQTKDSKLKTSIIPSLSWRIKSPRFEILPIRIIMYQVAEHYKINPGAMCQYFGPTTPVNLLEGLGDDNSQQSFIEINSRDFMAALQRLLVVKFEKFQVISANGGMTDKNFNPNDSKYSPNRPLSNQQQARGSPQIEKLGEDCKKYFICSRLYLPHLADPEYYSNSLTPMRISQDIILMLTKLTTDPISQVREMAIYNLGVIGAPEALEVLDHIEKALGDPDPQVRAMSCWALGAMGPQVGNKGGRKLIELLRDSYWKVRTAACISIGQIGSKFLIDTSFPVLIKILKEGTINKLTVCDTMIRLGIYGEQVLIDMLKKGSATDFKLRAAIIESFRLANVDKPTIDFIIEELFKNSKDNNFNVRKACLGSLEALRARSLDSNITYLKSKNILPLFYFFLQDSNQEIRELALSTIKGFGPQGELVFIEGLTKDKNPHIRAECAKGLALMGVQNFRAMIFGLRDSEETVRKATATAIRQFFTTEVIVEEYREKRNQIPALLCALKEILQLPFFIHEKSKKLLEEVLEELSSQNALNKSALSTHSKYQEAPGYEDSASRSNKWQEAM